MTEGGRGAAQRDKRREDERPRAGEGRRGRKKYWKEYVKTGKRRHEEMRGEESKERWKRVGREDER